MRSHRLWFCGSIVLALLAPGPAAAMAAGCDPDGAGHPSVAYIVGQQSDPNSCEVDVISGCGAVLLSPAIALTSGDCAAAWLDSGLFNLTAIWLNFNSESTLVCSEPARVDTFVLHPGYDPAAPDSPTNLAVIVLASASSVTPATLPGAGDVDMLLRNDPLDIVGFRGVGTSGSNRERSVSSFPLGRVTETLLKLRKGGDCVPPGEGTGIFLPGGQNLVGMTLNLVSGGSTGFHLRLDTPVVRDFLDDYVAVP